MHDCDLSEMCRKKTQTYTTLEWQKNAIQNWIENCQTAE